MAGDVVDLTRDMWRSYTQTRRRAITPSTSMSSFDPTFPSWASDGLPASGRVGIPSSASSFGEYTPATESGSVGDTSDLDHSESRQWGEVFKPSLSPIPSMAVSTVPDEDSSRGRTQSRWWEQSDSGSGSIGRPDRIEKSHRETKYMGVDLARLQDETEPSPALSRHTPTPGASTQALGSSSEAYPPEKASPGGLFDGDTPMATPGHAIARLVSDMEHGPLDVSRLLTLPPPYPRHHPAVNNDHPSLAELRNKHRELADHTSIQQIKDAYMAQDFAIRKEQIESGKERRTQLRSSISAKVADGSISFAEAAQAESDFEAEEAERGKANARSNFDIYENSVAQPLHNLLNHRLDQVNASIDKLRNELECRDQVSDPNQAQQEGDEEPERLEKLTLLKWLFEVREQLHRETFDLYAQRSDKYSEVILTPYRVQRSQSKIDEALAFFAKDSQERIFTLAKDSLKRYEELQALVETNVSRGVEDQLSAFWDIAPNLLELIQQVPADMQGFQLEIPGQEYEENPSYQVHPLQYLYSLLGHAEKSAFQFIESQTNLLCLLHEVRTAATKSRLRVMELERMRGGKEEAVVRADMVEARRSADDRLTGDLKEKVGEVERQWREALGEGLGQCRDRVREWLEESGGWEDGLDG